MAGMGREVGIGEGTPAPGVVAAWLVVGVLRAEVVPWFAAGWLVEGYDGEALAELAGLSGRDTREVRDLMPAALADVGVDPLPSKQEALKVAFGYIAAQHLSGLVGWVRAISEAQELVIACGYSSEVFEEPLSAFWAIDDEFGEPWARTPDELAVFVRQTCIEQLQI